MEWTWLDYFVLFLRAIGISAVIVGILCIVLLLMG